uniref:Uncharacterized protein n=1 Tax=Sphaerodactylus townsendi TaxID=933632 RepID=A0ACB8GET0_9SAUR
MERCGGDYEDEIEQVPEVGALLDGAVAGWYVGLYKGRAPELRSLPCFMLALQQQCEDPFEEEKARARLQQIRQGSRSVRGTSPACSVKEAGESLYAWQRQLALCGREGHKMAMFPSKKPDPPVVPASGAAKARAAKGPERKSPFRKGSGLQVELREVSLASKEAGGPESSEELAGNDNDLA